MLEYIIRRLLLIIPVLFGVSIVVFLMNQLIPGDPVDFLLGPEATPNQKEVLKSHLGLDQPLLVQYFIWVFNILQGDFGLSITRQTDVLLMILGSLKNTVVLIIIGGTFALLSALIIGTLSAMYPRSILASIANIIGVSGVSIPNFWVALMLISLFSVTFDWLPASGMKSAGDDSHFLDTLKHLILPSFTIGLITLGTMTRIVRSTFSDLLNQDFVLTLKAKGQGKLSILKHVFKNALPPILTVAGLDIGYLLGGSVIIESIFNWPGVGKLIYDSIAQRDFPVIQGGILIISFLFVTINMTVDVIHAYVDPRIRKSLTGGR